MKKRKSIYGLKPKAKKTYLKNQIDQVICWAIEELGITIEFSSEEDDSYFYYIDHIVINNKKNLYCQLSSLLHEVGHASLHKSKKYKERFSGSFFTSENQIMGKENKVDLIREEILAWEEGLKIAEINKIKLNKKRFYTHYKNCIWAYISTIPKSKHGLKHWIGF